METVGKFGAVVACILLVIGLFAGAIHLDAEEQKEQERENLERSTSKVLLGRGIDTNEQYPLLALRRESEQVTRAQGDLKGGGAFFFLVGGASVSGNYSQTTQNEYFVGFVADLAGQPVVLRLPASKFDFRLAQVEQPQVRLFVYETLWGVPLHGMSPFEKDALPERYSAERVELISTTYILERDIGRAVITLSPEQFAEDVAVLKYAYEGTR